MTFNIFFPIPAGLKMTIVPQTSLFLGIIPALFLLFIGLKGYEGHYNERTIFLTFVVGIILGFISAAIRIWINSSPLWIAYILLFALLFALFEQLFKTIVLNISRLQGKKETTIYGLSLGLGFGAVFTPFLIIVASQSGLSNAYYIYLIAIGSLGIILFHGATGAYIGYGVYERKMLRYLIIAIILQIPFNVITDMTRFYLSNYFAFFQFALVIYGAIVFWYVIKKIMPQILSRSQRRHRIKKNLDKGK